MIKILRETNRILFKNKDKERHILNAIRHFRKYGRMAPITPGSIQIQTQSACNGKCVYCPYPETSRTVSQGKMEWETFTKIVDEAAAWRDLVRVELMLQNEPLMDRDLVKCVRYVKSVKPNMKVGIVTNAMFLDRVKAEELAESGIDEVRISLDCFTKETYEALHPGFSFQKALAAIDLMNGVKKDYLSVVVSFVLTSKNIEEFESFIRFVKSKNLRWETIYLLNRASNVKDYERLRLTKHSWRYIKLRLMHKYIFRTCTMPFFSLSVLFNGDVIICCQDWKREIVIGNVKNSTLLDIWDSEKYNSLRKKIIERRFREITTCSSCTLAELCS